MWAATTPPHGTLPALLLRERLISTTVEKRRGVNAHVSSKSAVNAIPFVIFFYPIGRVSVDAFL
jgi:hypothetical protein